MTFWRFIHVLSILLFTAGVGSTVAMVWRAWMAEAVEDKAIALQAAQSSHTLILLPGIILTLFTGYAWAASAEYNVVTTGWLVALQVLTFLDLFIFVPLMGVGLRRVRILALAAKKHGGITPELKDALADNVPLVFGTLIALTIPVMVWLPIFKPF